MKSMLYVGAALMIGASIYGFVDYRETSQKKEFNNMYDHKEVKKPVVSDVKTEVVTEKKDVVIEKKEAAEVKKTAVAKTDEKKKTDKPVVKKKKNKKLDYRKFSRAPLREEEEVPIEEPAKKQ